VKLVTKTRVVIGEEVARIKNEQEWELKRGTKEATSFLRHFYQTMVWLSNEEGKIGERNLAFLGRLVRKEGL